VAPWPQSVIAGLGQDQEPETRTPMSRWQSRRSESVTSPSDGGGPARRGPPTALRAPPGRSAVCGIRHCPQLVRPGCTGPELSHCKSLSRLLPLTGTIPHDSELGLGLSPGRATVTVTVPVARPASECQRSHCHNRDAGIAYVDSASATPSRILNLT
jgi:hypothetical protein